LFHHQAAIYKHPIGVYVAFIDNKLIGEGLRTPWSDIAAKPKVWDRRWTSSPHELLAIYPCINTIIIHIYCYFNRVAGF